MRAQVSPPDVSSCAIIFLVLGDMAAALIGVSFGGEVASLKLGREGKKSVEGSLAMFCVCFLVAMVFFWDVQLSEYAAVVAAATATLTELYEPLLLDDNLTIPSRAVWKSTSELVRLPGMFTPSSRRSYGENIASMAWGARNLISTQVLLGAGFASGALPRALPALRERARGAVLPLLMMACDPFSFELTKCVVSRLAPSGNGRGAGRGLLLGVGRPASTPCAYAEIFEGVFGCQNHRRVQRRRTQNPQQQKTRAYQSIAHHIDRNTEDLESISPHVRKTGRALQETRIPSPIPPPSKYLI